MNNAQLAIFLEKIRLMLSTALDSVESNLPEELKSTSKNILGHEIESFPVLDPVYMVLGSLDDDIDILKNGCEDARDG